MKCLVWQAGKANYVVMFPSPVSHVATWMEDFILLHEYNYYICITDLMMMNTKEAKVLQKLDLLSIFFKASTKIHTTISTPDNSSHLMMIHFHSFTGAFN